MIEVKFYETDYRFCIDIKGHADYAPHGQDIVCASISTLAEALGNYVIEHETSLGLKVLEVKLEPGDTRVEYMDMYEGGFIDPVLVNIFKLIREEIEAIANMYPANVKIV